MKESELSMFQTFLLEELSKNEVKVQNIRGLGNRFHEDTVIFMIRYSFKGIERSAVLMGVRIVALKFTFQKYCICLQLART
jgi:hypothetical protein